MSAFLLDWGTPAGLIMTMLGIMIGLFPPIVITADYGLGKDDETRARKRYWFSVALIFVGTALQLYPSLPRAH